MRQTDAHSLRFVTQLGALYVCCESGLTKILFSSKDLKYMKSL